MAYDISNLPQADYKEIPFVPSASVRARESRADVALVAIDEAEPNYYIRAICGGLVGAVIGAVCYAAFVDLTGWSLGYLAILVGWLVGKGMMMGSEDRGGTDYQVAAVALTYLSVAAARGGLVWLWASRGRPVPVGAGTLLGMAKVGLLYPLLAFERSPKYAVIGLIILFVGMRAAYRMTSDNPGERRSPFKR